jgi:hypothetical protein
MNLKRAIFWKQSAQPQRESIRAEPNIGLVDGDQDGQAAHVQPFSATVVPLRRGAEDIGMPATMADFAPSTAAPLRLKGLLNAPELEAFFATNQFGFGRHHGSHYRTADALERGLDALVAQFQNIVADLAERRHAKADKLLLARHDVATLNDAMAARLDAARGQLQREVDVLQQQHALATERKGWVLDALNRYRLGFDRGVREALDFELLNA